MNKYAEKVYREADRKIRNRIQKLEERKERWRQHYEETMPYYTYGMEGEFRLKKKTASLDKEIKELRPYLDVYGTLLHNADEQR